MWKHGTYHSLKNLRYFTHGEFNNQTDGLLLLAIFFIFVFVLDLLKQLLRFLLVVLVPYACVAGYLAVFVDDPQANDLVAVFHEFFNEPFDGIVGVVVVVGAAEEGAAALGVLVILVFGGDSEGVVGCVAVVEGVEGDAAFVLACRRLVP